MDEFRQGTTGRLLATFLTPIGRLVDQPSGLPTVEVIYIDPNTSQPVTALTRSLMRRISLGLYFFDWRIPLDQPQQAHQIIYRGQIDELLTIGEDTVTILGATPECAFVPSKITTTKSTTCRCR